MNYNDDDGSITVKFDTAKEMYDVLTDISYADQLNKLQNFAHHKIDDMKKFVLEYSIKEVLGANLGIELNYGDNYCILRYGYCNTIRVNKVQDGCMMHSRLSVDLSNLIDNAQLGRIIMLMDVYLDSKL